VSTIVGADLTGAYYAAVCTVLLRTGLSRTELLETGAPWGLPQLPARQALALRELDARVVELFPLPAFVARKGQPPWDPRSGYDLTAILLEVSLFAETPIDDTLGPRARWEALDAALASSVEGVVEAGGAALFLLGVSPDEALARLDRCWSSIDAVVPEARWRSLGEPTCRDDLRALSRRSLVQRVPEIAEDPRTSPAYGRWLQRVRRALEA